MLDSLHCIYGKFLFKKLLAKSEFHLIQNTAGLMNFSFSILLQQSQEVELHALYQNHGKFTMNWTFLKKKSEFRVFFLFSLLGGWLLPAMPFSKLMWFGVLISFISLIIGASIINYFIVRYFINADETQKHQVCGTIFQRVFALETINFMHWIEYGILWLTIRMRNSKCKAACQSDPYSPKTISIPFPNQSVLFMHFN